jgi:alpha-galactosidase
MISGFFSCDFVGGTAHWLGSIMNEASDAKTFASWGADYLKVCGQCYGIDGYIANEQAVR